VIIRSRAVIGVECGNLFIFVLMNLGANDHSARAARVIVVMIDKNRTPQEG
jgi:hypothetical protein